MVERNLAKVEVESSRLFSRSIIPKREANASLFCRLHTLRVDRQRWKHRRDSKAVMHRIANPISPVRLRVAPPVSMRVPSGFALLSLLQFGHHFYNSRGLQGPSALFFRARVGHWSLVSAWLVWLVGYPSQLFTMGFHPIPRCSLRWFFLSLMRAAPAARNSNRRAVTATPQWLSSLA